jgi:UDP-glucuronate 4-epimerase
MIFASSSSVYGAHAEVPFREDDPADRPISPYAATKRAAELICHTYHHLYGLPVTCLRLFTVYGPRQRPDLAINRFTRAIHAGDPITMYGDGHSARDYTFISDIVDGFVAALDAEPALGYEIINLGNSSPVPLTALIALIARTLGREAVIRHEPDQPGDVPRTYASIEKANRILGWRPRVPIEEGIRRYVAWFLERTGDTAASPAAAR